MHIFNNTISKHKVISSYPICHIGMASLNTPTCHAQCATVTNFSLSAPAHSNTPDLAILLSKESLGIQF